ncbi:MAG TPA: hypothetical protein VIG99_33685 [Myxococcaceae bacterium]|jgi:hypothetical protein
MRAVALSLAVWFASVPLVAVAGEGSSDGDEVSESEPAERLDGTALYFRLEIRREGRLIAMPQFLGEAGKVLRAERRPPGAGAPDYRLIIAPFQQSEHRFHLKLDVAVPGQQGSSQIQMSHGEARKLELGQRKGDLEVKLLLMKVDSPEFRALMKLNGRDAGHNTI